MTPSFVRTSRRSQELARPVLGQILTSLTCVLVLSAIAAPLPAAAQGSADALVDRGVELRRSGDDEGALALFAEAWEQTHGARARAQMALAEQALGRFVEAEAHLLEALAVQDDAWIARRRADLTLALEAIQHRLGYLELRGGIEGADVRLDGRSVARLPLERPLRLVTGSYRLEIVARRHYPITRIVTIASDATTRELLEMTPMPDAPGSVALDSDGNPASVRSSTGRPRRAIAASVLGVGAAAFGGAVAAFVVRERRAEDYNSDECLAGGRTRGENCGDLHEQAIRAQRASYATLGVGIAAATVGSLLFAIGGDEETPTTASFACGAEVVSVWGARCVVRF